MTNRQKRTTLGFGSVSSGTMRAEDLIPAFLNVADRLRLRKADRATVRDISRRSRASDAAPYWAGDDPAADLDSLCDVLNNHCPAYAYFGAHPGDGADYGVWLSESFEDDFDGLKVSDTSEVPTGYSGEVLHVSDHGNPTLYTARKGKLSEVWSLV